ncbi:MAG TPA: PAS domain S-box protein [Pseudomonadales bacterium]
MPLDAASGGTLLRRTLAAFLPLALVGLLVMAVLLVVLALAVSALFREEQEKLVSIGRHELAGELSGLIADASYLARSQSVARWLDSGSAEDALALARDFVTFVAEKRVYDRLRFVDTQGREIARANWNDGRPAAVAAEALRGDIDEVFLDEFRNLRPGQVYVSRFELAREDGRVVEPRKPVIRVGTPVHDASGERRGTLLLQYLGADLLEQIHHLAAEDEGQMWLLDRGGHWLVGPRPEDEFVFMYPERQQRTVRSLYPEVWARMEQGPPMGQFRHEGGLFTYSRTQPVNWGPGENRDSRLPAGSARSWYVVSHVPAAVVIAGRNQLLVAVLVAYLLLAAVLAGVAVLLARQRLRRERTEAELKASDARFRQFVESAPDAVVIVDGDGRIRMVNAETERMFGHPRAGLVGRAVEVLLPERYHDAHVRHRAGYGSDPRLRPMGEGLELHGRRADGSEFPVEISLSPVQTDAGLLVLADIRDVTERRQQARRIRELNERLTRDNAELEALNRELEAFSYSVSHDLRAPLRAIDGFSQALLEDFGDRLGPEARGHLDRVRNAAQRMGQLIDDLLKLSRVARAQLDLQEVDLSALAREVTDELQRAEPAREVEIDIRDGLRVTADPRLLRIALENLFDNAWKFTGGRSPGRIELGCTEADGETVFDLRDNGVGFDMAYVDQLFRAFQRLHDAREFPGTGIGLATVQRIVHKHGGRIWAEAVPGRGAAFHFTLGGR